MEIALAQLFVILDTDFVTANGSHLTTDPSGTNTLAGNIAHSILGRFIEVFDYMRGRLYFERTTNSDPPEIFYGFIFDSFGHGLQVMTVLPGTPGEQAGLQAGDLITAIDDKALEMK